MASIDIKKIKTKQGDLPISATNYEADGTIAAKFTELETKINNAETQFFQTTLETEENHLQAIVRVVADKTLHEGDIAVVKELIAGDKFSYTSYVYDGNN
jgi:hypothetical protein